MGGGPSRSADRRCEDLTSMGHGGRVQGARLWHSVCQLAGGGHEFSLLGQKHYLSELV